MMLWVYGPAGIGKKTLIFSAASTNYRGSGIVKKLGVGFNDLVIPLVIPNRVGGKSHEEVIEVVRRREAIIHDAYSSKMDAVWLIHMQTVDIAYGISERVVSKNSHVESCAVYLKISEGLYEKINRRDRSYKKAYRHMGRHLEDMSKIFGGVEVLKIDELPVS